MPISKTWADTPSDAQKALDRPSPAANSNHATNIWIEWQVFVLQVQMHEVCKNISAERADNGYPIWLPPHMKH